MSDESSAKDKAHRYIVLLLPEYRSTGSVVNIYLYLECSKNSYAASLRRKSRISLILLHKRPLSECRIYRGARWSQYNTGLEDCQDRHFPICSNMNNMLIQYPFLITTYCYQILLMVGGRTF